MQYNKYDTHFFTQLGLVILFSNIPDSFIFEASSDTDFVLEFASKDLSGIRTFYLILSRVIFYFGKAANVYLSKIALFKLVHWF